MRTSCCIADGAARHELHGMLWLDGLDWLLLHGIGAGRTGAQAALFRRARRGP